MNRIWTIGYEKAGLPDFIAALKREGIELVLDVREVANSRRAGFSKKILAASLDEAGISYVHMKALGTPKAGRDAARRGDVAGMQAIYAQKLESPEAQLALLECAEFMKTRRACLMCLEDDWRSCHRAMVAEHLASLGAAAVHICLAMS